MFLRIATQEHPYVIAFFPIENRRWLLSYIGVNKQYPPSREDQFTSEQFDQIFSEYKLFRYVEQPGLLLSQMQTANA